MSLSPATLFAATPGSDASVCYGVVANGRLSGGVQLPEKGPNYLAYSSLGVSMGRTYVHATVRDIVVSAYQGALLTAPGVTFTYGETGHATGGRFRPHRTHQAGISVDFMVPVRDTRGASIPLPANALNKFGYAWEFDDTGRSGALRIDFDAMAEHLHQVSLAAQQRKVRITRVIFDPRLTTLLLQTRRGAALAGTLPFMKQPAWIRHDEHYHIDFAIDCKPLSQYTPPSRSEN